MKDSEEISFYTALGAAPVAAVWENNTALRLFTAGIHLAYTLPFGAIMTEIKCHITCH